MYKRYSNGTYQFYWYKENVINAYVPTSIECWNYRRCFYMDRRIQEVSNDN